MSQARQKTHFVSNKNGWELELKQCHPPKRAIKKRRPLMIIPGYGMNSFIFGYHPSGLSMETYLTRMGFEVWSVNLRGQGESRWRGGKRRYGLKELAVEDLKAAVDFVVKTSRSEAGRIDLIGCSLGGTLAYIYASFVQRHKAGSIVGIGSPLRWDKVHPILRLASLSPRMLEKIPIVGVREILRGIYPKLLKSPFVKLYLHPEIVDLSDPKILFNTVENPNRHINRQIAEWIKAKDLWLDEESLTDAFRKVKKPLLCVLANRDGIVPPLTALSPLEIAASKVKETLVVGDDSRHYAHADLFISRYSHDQVFKPVGAWLLAQYR